MATVLFVKANDRPADQAVSVQLYEAFLNAYKAAHPADEVVELDLYKEVLPFYGNDAITGAFKQAQGYELTAAEQAGADLVNRYLNQFLAADKYVFAFPLWNFVAPAPLTNYVAYLSQAGKTFKYTAEGPVGLVTGKKAILLNARGGVYSEGPAAEVEAAIRPLQGSLGMFGIATEQIVIEGHNQFQDRAAAIVEEGLKKAAEVAASF